MEEILTTIGTLIEYGIAFATLATVTIGFITDTIRSGKAADRELSREKEISATYSRQVDELTNALEKRNDLDEMRLQMEKERAQ